MPKPAAVIDAPSNLGLRPPGPGREPGVRRLASALRGRGIVLLHFEPSVGHYEVVVGP